MTSISIPDSVTSIGQYSFDGCTGLTSIELPGVTSLANYALRNCSNVTSIVFGPDVTSIGAGTFYGCSACLLYDFRAATSVPSLSSAGAFTTTNANKKIVVPDALYNTWIATVQWSSSSNKVKDSIISASDYANL